MSLMSWLFYDKELTQLKLYYLFANADGECSPEETERLRELRKKLNLSSSDSDEFDTFCKSVGSTPVWEQAQKLISEARFGKQTQAEILWNLINLGYADSAYTPQERVIVSYLIDQWVMDKLLAQELTGAAEAIFALVKQKEWVMDTRKPYREIEAMVQEMDRNIASLYKDVEASIYDADIA